MKKFLIPVMVAASLIACNSEEPLFIDETINKEIRTDPNIKFFNVTKDAIRETSFGAHYLLGHGYDVTGEYASANAARKKIFDFTKPDGNFRLNISPIGMFIVRDIDYDNTEDFLGYLSNKHEDLVGTTSFKKSLEAFFPGQDHSKDYIYHEYTIFIKYEAHNFSPRPTLYDDEFIHAIQNHTPEEIVIVYGTHLLHTIILGATSQFIYRTETDNADRRKSSKEGLNVAMNNLFKPLDAEVNKLVALGNFNQQGSFMAKGGGLSKLHIAEIDGISRIDTKEWLASISEENADMVDMVLWPIYHLIYDETKQKELKDYIEKYIDENQFQ